MVVEYIRYTVSGNERRKELIEAYRQAAEALNKAPECLAYELGLCEEDETSAILRIEWKSTEAHLQGFRKSAVFQDFFHAIGGFVKEITEMRHYELSEVMKRKVK
jgi:quinol monooxygenase YgiN